MTTSTTVRTEDGATLHVELDEGPVDAPTVVMVHGFTAHLGEFALQRASLAGHAGVVLYDQRGHGRSSSGRRQHATIDQLGRDLAMVLERAVPAGPVVLLGHSMGGMTLLALARQRPELFGPRVRGVFLLATSSGGLIEKGPLALAIRFLRSVHLLVPLLSWGRLFAPLAERLRRRGTLLGRAYYRRYLFGTTDASPAAVRQVQDLLEQAPLPVVAEFYPTLLDYDETAALEVMRGVPVTLLVGEADRLTPVSHSRRMARALPDAELIVVPGAGHSVNITRPQLVDAALLRLVERSVATRAA